MSKDMMTFSGFEVYETKNNPEYKVSENSTEKFTALNGTITEIVHYADMYQNSYDEDYEGISNTGSVSFPEVNLQHFYKGKKICLKKANLENTGKQIDWSKLSSVLLGFISDQSFTTEGVDIKLVGMSKLLDQEKEFRFTKTKRSKILKEIIISSGLKAKIDTTGLKDEKIDYTNVSSNGSVSSGSVPKSIQQLADEIVGSETDEYKKFEKGHNWGVKNISYSKYECSRQDNDPEKCLKNKEHLNCGDTSILMNAIYTAMGLNSYIIHGNYHFWNIVTVNGKKYASDCSGKHKINEVWSTASHPNTPFGGNKVNAGAICG